VGEGAHVFDIRTGGVDGAANRGDLGNRGGEEPRDVDDRRAVRAVRVDVEDGYDRSVVRALHRPVDRERTVRRDREGDRSENDAVSVALPVQGALAELIAGVVAKPAAGRSRVGGRRAREPADDQHVLVELAGRNLEVEAVIELVHREKAAVCLGFGRDDAVVRSWTCGGGASAGPSCRIASSAALRNSWRRLSGSCRLSDRRGSRGGWRRDWSGSPCASRSEGEGGDETDSA